MITDAASFLVPLSSSLDVDGAGSLSWWRTQAVVVRVLPS